jgi:hypothetical protein
MDVRLAVWTYLSDLSYTVIHHSPLEYLVGVSGNFSQDVLGDFQKSFDGFVKSGQATALVIGIILGYVLSRITSF